MAGYLFLLDSNTALENCIRNGIYSTRLNVPNGRWRAHHEATFGDYITMQQADNVYFFIKRNIYGIGEIVKMSSTNDSSVSDCKFSNYPNACKPDSFNNSDIIESCLLNIGDDSANHRWLCVFKPSPHFFKTGIDMDELLSSNPNAFKMLRVLQRLSFIKFDDEENQAFKDILLKSNQDVLLNPRENINIFPVNITMVHNNMKDKLGHDYILDVAPFLSSCNDGNMLMHEMAIEAGILAQLSRIDQQTIEIFGDWDYLSHQVVASPFKPVAYMDKMDIFGYSYIEGHKPTKSKFLVIEVKKGEATLDDLEQLLKYVDWLKDEYASNDYSMINAFLVAYSFHEEILSRKADIAKRIYTIGRRPAETRVWDNLKLVRYSYNEGTEKIDFELND